MHATGCVRDTNKWSTFRGGHLKQSKIYKKTKEVPVLKVKDMHRWCPAVCFCFCLTLISILGEDLLGFADLTAVSHLWRNSQCFQFFLFWQCRRWYSSVDLSGFCVWCGYYTTVSATWFTSLFLQDRPIPLSLCHSVSRVHHQLWAPTSTINSCTIFAFVETIHLRQAKGKHLAAFKLFLMK